MTSTLGARLNPTMGYHKAIKNHVVKGYLLTQENTGTVAIFKKTRLQKSKTVYWKHTVVFVCTWACLHVYTQAQVCTHVHTPVSVSGPSST